MRTEIELLPHMVDQIDDIPEDLMKKWLKRSLLAIGLAALAAAPAAADLKVATSLTDLASVAEHVGGKHVTAQSLCRGFEDPHFVPAKPSLMKAIQHADVFISSGLELDGGWLPLVLPGSRNPKIQPGAKGFVDEVGFPCPQWRTEPQGRHC